MTIHNHPDDEIYEAAIPIWEEMMRGSNAIDYDLFSKDFSVELKERVKKDNFEKQCNSEPLLTNLGTAIPIACIRREDSVTIIFKLLSTALKGEFVGQIRLSGTIKNLKVTDAQVY